MSGNTFVLNKIILIQLSNLYYVNLKLLLNMLLKMTKETSNERTFFDWNDYKIRYQKDYIKRYANY